MHVNRKVSECEWGEPTISVLSVVSHKVDTCIVLANLLQSCVTFYCMFLDNYCTVCVHYSVPYCWSLPIAIPISCESRSTCFSSMYCS